MPNHIRQVHDFPFCSFIFLAILIPAYERWIGVRFPPGARDSSFHQSTEIYSEAHSSSFALAIMTYFFDSKVAMAEADASDTTQVIFEKRVELYLHSPARHHGELLS